MKKNYKISKIICKGLALVLLITGCLANTVVASAETVNEKVAAIKNNNQKQRELLTSDSYGDNWSYDYFGVVDLNNDGLLEAVAGDEGCAKALTYINGDSVYWIVDIWTYGSFMYDVTTGNILAYDADVEGNLFGIWICEINESGQWLYEYMQEDFSWFVIDDLSNETKAELKEKVDLYVPNRTTALCEYKINETNLNQYLPVDEDVIRAALESSEGESENGGNVLVDNNTENNALGAKFLNSEDVMNKINLTDTEKAAIEDGKNIVVSLGVVDEGTEAGEDVEKLAILDALDGKKLGTFLDITLFTKLMNKDGNIEADSKNEVHNTNGTIKITIEVPESLRAEGRTFSVLRYHDGQVDVLTSSQNSNTITFETDRFSTYALTYIDGSNQTTESPKTGDTNAAMNALVMMLISGLGIIFVGKKKSLFTVK